MLVLGLIYYVLKRRYSPTYREGAFRQSMEPVSSSMLLSETDPAKCAQVHIVTFIVFEGKISFVDFRDRFIQNVVQSDGDSRFQYILDCSQAYRAPMWIKARGWNPQDNCSSVPEPQTIETARRLISQRLTKPLDIRKPVWDLQFIESYMCNSSGVNVSAAILTMHHSMGDGFTLCHQIMRRAAPAEDGISLHECYPFNAPTQNHHSRSIKDFVQTISKLVASACKLLFLAPDPPSPLRNTAMRTLDDSIIGDMFELGHSVDDLKRMAHDATILLRNQVRGKIYLNDVVVAACALVLGDLMGKARHDVTSAIWIGLNRKSVIDRPKQRRFDWGNENLGTCYLKLPTGESDPLKALITSHERLHDLKSSPEPMVANALLKLLGSIPLWILWPFRAVLMDKMSASISNFPGPVRKIKIPVAPDGKPNRALAGVGVIRDAYFFVAPPFRYGPYVTILSYCGRMYFGISAAEKLMSKATLRDLSSSKIDAAIRQIDLALRSDTTNKQSPT